MPSINWPLAMSLSSPDLSPEPQICRHSGYLSTSPCMNKKQHKSSCPKQTSSFHAWNESSSVVSFSVKSTIINQNARAQIQEPRWPLSLSHPTFTPAASAGGSVACIWSRVTTPPPRRPRDYQPPPRRQEDCKLFSIVLLMASTIKSPNSV